MATFVLRLIAPRPDFADEQALREFASQDPVVTTKTGTFEFARMAAGHIRRR